MYALSPETREHYLPKVDHDLGWSGSTPMAML